MSDLEEIDDLDPESEDNEQGEELHANLPEDDDAGAGHKTIHLSGMYKNWFLDYASYVILERAVPDVKDGLKPVQRRILHAMKDLDDGRFNKVANIIGHTMQYHPHGDASIGDALVQLGQKDLLIDTQGNWGNILTGDSAAASRYIEARLSKFANDVVFNPKTTTWKLSYDGRKREPVALPVKFPLLLAQGVEGIAVGLASKILPHNFIELIDGSINILKGQDFDLVPDFPTGGYADVSRYNDGNRGGRVRVRAKIHQLDKKTLVITEIPFGTNTGSLIDSIVSANDKGKIKIKKIDDNTAENVEIMVHLAPNVSPDQTIDALYAFTNCEMSLSPNTCVIDEGRPRFIGVKEVLRISTQNTVDLLQKELEIRLAELNEQWHFSSLEKIFIEKRIYRKIEECETWEAVIEAIDKGLNPYKKLFKREITEDDIVKLTEIRIKRISKFNAFKADEQIKQIEGETEEVNNHLAHLVDYAINYYRQIKKKYGEGKERKTELRSFDTIEATRVAAASQKLYVNREEGFAGTSLRRDEYVCDCSDIDDIIVFREDGTYLVTKVSAKTFVGKGIIHIDVFNKSDDRTIYNVVYRDGKKGACRVKRFAVTSITRDKEYDLTKGSKDSKVVYFTANPNGEAEVIKVSLTPKPRMKKTSMEFDFSELDIKGRGAQGNLLTKFGVRKIVKREEGVSTLGAIDIWYDDTVKRLNTDDRGKYLGAFKSDDKILTIQKSGNYKLMSYDLGNHFDEEMFIIEKFDPRKILSVVYFDATIEKYYVKRFTIEDDVIGKKVDFIDEEAGNTFHEISLDYKPQLEVKFENDSRGNPVEDEVINVEEFIGIKGYKAKGKRVSNKNTTSIRFTDPIPYEPEPDEEELEEQIEQNETEEQVVEQGESEIVEEKGLLEPMGEEPPGISETQQNIKAPEINIIKKVDKNKEDDASQMQLDFE
ncbi:MAG TPA: DNA gyrase/topoisomerase IV subunit A [Bacteroidales bacterium]|nr:DNA gyrase/topoisomerase IV subunit A [Bacteroidales bacterium]HRX97602.1 DNA gyrase/topoisomerase IV subunit A [Bacteroidales bacterium]